MGGGGRANRKRNAPGDLKIWDEHPKEAYAEKHNPAGKRNHLEQAKSMRKPGV